MPFIEATVAAGRTPEQLRSLMSELHGAVERSLGAPAQSIRVVVREVPPEHWSSGGVTLAEKAAAAGT
ncbi:4-oxalocrotonate tautomerase family protein [Herbiconiux sp.]|jgi:4-oxalocrotonate tautomerase|uniref:tautomerase family protein n=1 Tax=Herbiconiux sp. TaxID=1871186 RepID=UPI0025BCAE19|nr:4-oxalocrotonate tautomerase family protein [Herbiconiux sp.]